MTQSALAKERRELKEQQQRTLLEAIPKDLSRCGRGWRPAQACTSASVLHNSGLPAGIAPSKELHQQRRQHLVFRRSCPLAIDKHSSDFQF